MTKSTSKQSTPSITYQITPMDSSIPFRHAYGPKLKVALTFEGPGRTLQSFKDECDINVIMSRYEKDGHITHLAKLPPVWGEVPDLDFQAAMNLVVEAREKFAALGAGVRDRFANDPLAMVRFLQNPENRAEAIKLGLINAPAAAPEAPSASPSAPPATPLP